MYNKNTDLTKDILDGTSATANEKTWLKGLLEKFKRLEVIAIILAVLALWLDLSWKVFVENPALKRERAAQTIEREEASFAREMQAWAKLSDKRMGSGGFGEALNYLLNKTSLVSGLDLSCHEFNGELVSRGFLDTYACDPELIFPNWEIVGRSDLFKGYDPNRLLLEFNYMDALELRDFSATGAKFESSTFSHVFFLRGNFMGSDFFQSTLHDTIHYLGSMEDTNITSSRFSNSHFMGVNFKNAVFRGVDFQNSTCIKCSFQGASFHKVNITNTNLRQASGLPTDTWREGVWAWADYPPTLPEGVPLPRLCSANLRETKANLGFQPDWVLDANLETSDFDIPKGCKVWQWADWPVKNIADGEIIKSCDPGLRSDYYELTISKRPDIPKGC
ncbi:pentapeptide repeat-containing protein [Fretibacter rubidus]|uniref:pentapeptide repeat-containing protein n=1 Tax=Fretibacter rubidus TaxID=570162 RepID=UPI00352B6D06